MAAVGAVAVAGAVEVLAVAVEVPLASLLAPGVLYQRHTNCSVSDIFATGVCPKANRT